MYWLDGWELVRARYFFSFPKIMQRTRGGDYPLVFFSFPKIMQRSRGGDYSLVSGGSNKYLVE